MRAHFRIVGIGNLPRGLRVSTASAFSYHGLTRKEIMMKTWLITGASRGLGMEMAKAVLASGDRLVATGRAPKQVAAALGEEGDRLCDFPGFSVSSNRQARQDSRCESTIGRGTSWGFTSRLQQGEDLARPGGRP